MLPLFRHGNAFPLHDGPCYMMAASERRGQILFLAYLRRYNFPIKKGHFDAVKVDIGGPWFNVRFVPLREIASLESVIHKERPARDGVQNYGFVARRSRSIIYVDKFCGL
jgi:hypothetical protein